MGVNLLHIAEGWGKSLGLLSVSEENQVLSKVRMKICSTCEHATESSFLQFIGKEVHEMGAIICQKCPSLLKCPVNEKTLVTKEKCPVGKW
jgi:formate dehydrogenase maturation protein FdhE